MLNHWRTHWILWFLCAFYALRLYLIGTVQLAPDEAFYWYWAKHPDLSYLDHPPMVAYIMALFTVIGGDNVFFVRVGGLLCTAVAHFFIYRTMRQLAPVNDEISWGILLVLNSTLLFAAGCLIQTPDTPLLLFWSMGLYCGAVIATGGRAAWWYLYGIALGLGLLSKYTMILIVPCQMLFLMSSSRHRHWFMRKEPYLALFIALILFSPVIIWNWQHHWVSFGFQLGQGFSPDKDALLSKLGEYVGGQFGVATPLLLLAFGMYSVKGYAAIVHEKRDDLRFLACMSWPILLFFGLSTAIGDTAEANWPAPAHIAGLMLTWTIFQRGYRNRHGHKRFMFTAIGLGLALNLLLHAHLVRPFIPIAPNQDNTKQMRDWKALGKNLSGLISNHPSQRGYFLIANRRTTVAQAVFHTRNQYTGIHLFDLDKYTFLDDLDLLKGKDALIVVHQYSDRRMNRYMPYFKQLKIVGKNDYRYRGQKIEDLSATILLGKHFRGIEPAS